ARDGGRPAAAAGFRAGASHLPDVWHAGFHLQVTFGEKVLRSVLVYVFLLLVANAVQNGIIGNDVSVTGAVVGATTLFVLNEALNRTTYALPWAARVIEGEPTILIENGKPLGRALFRAGISLPELRAIARRQGYADLTEVHTAILETNGVISMFKRGEPQVYHPAEAGGLRIGKRRRARS